MSLTLPAFSSIDRPRLFTPPQGRFHHPFTRPADPLVFLISSRRFVFGGTVFGFQNISKNCDRGPFPPYTCSWSVSHTFLLYQKPPPVRQPSSSLPFYFPPSSNFWPLFTWALSETPVFFECLAGVKLSPSLSNVPLSNTTRLSVTHRLRHFLPFGSSG